MKRKLLLGVLSLACVVASVFAVAGCEHTCEYEILKEDKATCTKEGYIEEMCSCGNFRSYGVDKLGHSFKTYLLDEKVSCEENETQTAKCERCEELHTVVLEETAWGHDCNEAGKCSRCEYVAGQDLEYRKSQDGTYYAVHGIGNCTYSCIVIPSEYEGLPVTTIDPVAFSSCLSLKRITIPESVIAMNSTFSGCKNLEKITVAEGNGAYQSIDGNLYTKDGSVLLSYAKGKKATEFEVFEFVTEIAAGAFAECEALTSVTFKQTSVGFPRTLTIGEEAFYRCKGLSEVEIPARTISIGKSAFEGCQALQELRFEEGDFLTAYGLSIGEDAFSRCWLEELEIPERTEFIGESAFWNSPIKTIRYNAVECEGEEGAFKDAGQNRFSVTIGANVKIIPDELFRDTSLAEVVFEKGSVCEYIGEKAFYNCKIAKINIPESVTKIGSSAFEDCKELTEISIPESVTEIGSGAFNDCKKLTDIQVHEENVAYQSIDGNLYTKDGKTLLQYAIGKTEKSFAVPVGVMTIGRSAFSGCEALENVILPENIMTIEHNAFFGCLALTEISIPQSVTVIEWAAFLGCSNLKSVHFENTEGWTYQREDWIISSEDLLDLATAASYLTKEYIAGNWQRIEK